MHAEMVLFSFKGLWTLYNSNEMNLKTDIPAGLYLILLKVTKKNLMSLSQIFLAL